MIDKIVNLLKNHFGEKLIALVVFGSYARGDFRESSDIDLFLIIEGLPQRHFERTTLMSSLLTPNFSRRITAFDLDPVASGLLMEATSETTYYPLMGLHIL